MKLRNITGFWLRLTGVLIAFGLVLVLAVVMIGYGIQMRALALLSVSSGIGWQINLLEVDRGIQHALTRDSNRYGFMWSLDGQEIGYSSGVTGFIVMDWTGHNRRPMADSDTWLIPFARGISNFDSEWNASKSERVFSDHDEIYICDIDCAHRQQITNDGSYHDASPAWSPDDQRIVFVSNRGGAYIEIFVMRRDGSSIQQLTHTNIQNWTPDWSADGRQIAFVGTLGINGEVFVMDADGQHLRRVTYNRMNDTNPVWQP